MTMKWRLIEEETYDAAANMALDHAIYENVAAGRELPTIRFYKWKKNSISLGAYQNPAEINLDECRKNNVDIVRRMTGGRAVFHDMNDFTYSVIAPIRVFGYSIEKAYRDICYWIIDALTELGIESNLENKNDILVKGKKISGNAAKALDKGIYLQHGTLIYDLDLEIMPSTLNIKKELVKGKVTSVLKHKKIDRKEVYESLRSSFAFGKEFFVDTPSKTETEKSQELAKERYRSIMLPYGSFMKNKGACYVERGG